MKIVSLLAPPPIAPWTVADMKADQVFKVGEDVYIRTQRAVTPKEGYEVFYVNSSSIYMLNGSKIVTPIEAEFHIV